MPSAPENLAVTGQESTSLAVNWDDVVGASSYTVTVSQNGVQVSVNSASVSEWTQTGLTAQTTYTIAVVAVNAAGDGAQSDVSSITGALTYNRFVVILNKKNDFLDVYRCFYLLKFVNWNNIISYHSLCSSPRVSIDIPKDVNAL